MRNYASLLAPTNATGAAHWTAKANAVSANVMKHLWDSEREQLTAHIYNLHNVPGSSKNWSVCGDKWGSTEHAKDGGGAQNGKTSYSEPVLDSKRSLNQDRLGISIVKVEEEKASCVQGGAASQARAARSWAWLVSTSRMSTTTGPPLSPSKLRS